MKRGYVMLTINDDEMVAQVERLKYTMQLNKEIEYRHRQLLEREAIAVDISQAPAEEGSVDGFA